MKTPAISLKTIDGIQMLRGVAAVLVVFHHVLEQCRSVGHWIPTWLVLLGAVGVDIFFVISGFIMLHTTRQTHRSWAAALNFFKRRLLRIFPLYWIILLIFFFLHSTGRFYRSIHTDPVSDLCAFLLLPFRYPFVLVSWTLSYELYFYIIFAACLLLVRKSWRGICSTVLIALILVSANLVIVVLDLPGNFFTNAIVLEFAFGAVISVLVSHVEIPARLAAICIGVGLTCLIAASIYFGQGGADKILEPRFVYWGIPSSFLVIAATSRQLFSRKLPVLSGLLLLLGDSSYSLYLTHSFVTVVLATFMKNGLFRHTNALLLILVALLASLGVGLLVHYFIEGPLLAIGKLRHKNSRLTNKQILGAPPQKNEGMVLGEHRSDFEFLDANTNSANI